MYELKEAFFSLKTIKSSGADEINFNVIKHHFRELCGPLKYLSDSSLQSGLFPDLMKIAIISPVFKTGDAVDISNYRPISVLSCFSKIIERVMCNRLYKYLTDKKIFHTQQIGFRKSTLQNMQLLSLYIRSTNHVKTTPTSLALLSTCQRRLIQAIIQYL